MKEVQDSLQVGIANSTAIAFSVTECNEFLTFVSLILAISYTVFKFIKFEEQKKN